MHPDIHREIARQRQQELLASAERDRIAHATRRPSRRPSADSKLERRRPRRTVLDGAWEVRGSADPG